MTTYSVRNAPADELVAVQEIERRAATRFASVGLAAAVELPLQSIEALRASLDLGQLRVAMVLELQQLSSQRTRRP